MDIKGSSLLAQINGKYAGVWSSRCIPGEEPLLEEVEILSGEGFG